MSILRKNNKKLIEASKLSVNEHAIERNVTINGTYVRIKSIFGDIPLDKVLANIAKRRLAESKRSDKT